MQSLWQAEDRRLTSKQGSRLQLRIIQSFLLKVNDVYIVSVDLPDYFNLILHLLLQ